MRRSMGYISGVVCAVLAVLLPTEAYASQTQNLVSPVCLIYGPVYIMIASVKFLAAWRFRKKHPEVEAQKTGALFFLIAGLYMVAFPFIQTAAQGQIHPDRSMNLNRFLNLPAVKWPIILCLFAAPFLPWLMLAFAKNLRHLRRQGVIGFLIAAGVPVAFAVGTFFVFSLL